MVFSLFFHSWTCSSLCFYTLLQGRKSLLWKVIRSPLSTDTPKRFFNCKKFRHIWFWSKIYRFRPCILLTRKGLKRNINKSHAIKKKAINGSWFTKFWQTTYSNPRGGKEDKRSIQKVDRISSGSIITDCSIYTTTRKITAIWLA